MGVGSDMGTGMGLQFRIQRLASVIAPDGFRAGVYAQRRGGKGGGNRNMLMGEWERPMVSRISTTGTATPQDTPFNNILRRCRPRYIRAKYAAYCQASGSSKQITKTRPIEPQPTCANLCHLATVETYFKRLSHQHITEQKVFAVLLETGNGQNHESHPFSCPAARADAASHANRSSPKLPAKPLPPALPSRLPGVAVEAVWFVPRSHGIDWASRSMRSWGATKEKGKQGWCGRAKYVPCGHPGPGVCCSR